MAGFPTHYERGIANMNTTTRSPKARDIPDAKRYTMRDPRTGQFVKVGLGISRADLLRLRDAGGKREIIGRIGEYAAVVFFAWAEKFFPENEIIPGDK